MGTAVARKEEDLVIDFSVREVAQILNLTVWKVRRSLVDGVPGPGEIRGFRYVVGRNDWRVPEEEVRRLLEKGGNQQGHVDRYRRVLETRKGAGGDGR